MLSWTFVMLLRLHSSIMLKIMFIAFYVYDMFYMWYFLSFLFLSWLPRQFQDILHCNSLIMRFNVTINNLYLRPHTIEYVYPLAMCKFRGYSLNHLSTKGRRDNHRMSIDVSVISVCLYWKAICTKDDDESIFYCS